MATTNFFSNIQQLEIAGDLRLTISKGADDTLVVSLLVQNEQCGDNAKNLIPPFNLKGSANELDEGFFEHISVPVRSASSLMTNMEAFLSQMEAAQAQSAMEKEKAEKLKKDKEAREKKYKEAMTKADELEKDGRYRDAWIKVPDSTDYPEKADEIRKRKRELSEKFSSPSLFGAE